MTQPDNHNKYALVAGGTCIAAGLAMNEWTVGAVLSDDGSIDSPFIRAIIWLFDIFMVFLGACLVYYKPRLKAGLRELFFTLIVCVIFLCFLEGAFRLTFYLQSRNADSHMIMSGDLGWESTEDYSSGKAIAGYGDVTYSSTRNGFRVFGDPAANKTRIFVIGDSYTQARSVSDGKAYYDYLRGNNDEMEIFVYGCGGYGSYQEYLILDKYIDEIKPDIIVWQFSSNDIINNDYQLESKSLRNNNHMVRPYLINGEERLLYPGQRGNILSSLARRSYLLRYINVRLNIAVAERKGSIEDDLDPEHPFLKSSAAITTQIMRKAIKRAGTTPIVAFNVDKPEWLGDTYIRICNSLGIHFVPGVPEAVQSAKNEGVVVDGSPHDLHWNAAGHAIAGRLIRDYLRVHGFLKQ